MSAGLDLAEYVPYLLNRAGSRIAEAFTAVARDEGLTLGMWRALAVLRQAEPLTVGEIADWTTIEVSTLSRLLVQMQAKGLVRRERNARDSRQVLVSRTAAGAAATERLVPVALAFEDAATQGLSAEELATLKRLLRRLYDNMGALDALTWQHTG